MVSVNSNSAFDKILSAGTQKVPRPSGMLENHPDLTPISKERVYTDDYYNKTELEGAIHSAHLNIVQEAMTDGKKNVVAIEANIQDEYVDVVNYEARKTSDFTQGESEGVEGVVQIQISLVDDDPSDDSQQITINPEVGRMLANVPGFEVAKSGYFYLDDYDSESALLADVNRAAIEVGQHAETDGAKNIVTVEVNIEEGMIGVVSYQTDDTTEFTQGDKLELDGFLHLEVAYIDRVPEDDSGKFTLNLPPMRR